MVMVVLVVLVPMDGGRFFLTTMTSPCQCDQDGPICHRNITDLDNCTATTRAEVRRSGVEWSGV